MSGLLAWNVGDTSLSQNSIRLHGSQRETLADPPRHITQRLTVIDALLGCIGRQPTEKVEQRRFIVHRYIAFPEPTPEVSRENAAYLGKDLAVLEVDQGG